MVQSSFTIGWSHSQQLTQSTINNTVKWLFLSLFLRRTRQALYTAHTFWEIWDDFIPIHLQYFPLLTRTVNFIYHILIILAITIKCFDSWQTLSVIWIDWPNNHIQVHLLAVLQFSFMHFTQFSQTDCGFSNIHVHISGAQRPFSVFA